MTMTLVSTVTVGAGGAASIEWTGIPGSATDLLLVVSARSSSTSQYFTLRLNGSTANFSQKDLSGNGSTAASSGDTAVSVGAVQSGYTANTFSNTSLYIPNYAGSTNKSISVDYVSENNATATFMNIQAGLWSNTAAITTLTIAHSSQTFVQYSTASLYTITKGSGGATVA